MLLELFIQLLAPYLKDKDRSADLWQEIVTHYSTPERSYHNLSHLQAVYVELIPYRHLLQDPESVWFALLYHDIIYDPVSKANEKHSAELAATRLSAIGYPPEKLERCKGHILATAGHPYSSDADTNLFTDADLSILGQAPDVYLDYSRQVRKEYAAFPDALYNSGRMNVLTHFLSLQRIYKTDPFYTRFELAARENLGAELQRLSLQR